DFSIEWIERTKYETAGNPAFEVAWRSFDKTLAHTREYNASGHEIVDHGNHVPVAMELEEGKDYGLVIDMGDKTLGRIFIDAEAPEGTVFNIAFTEDTIKNRPWILKRVGLYTGARYTAATGSDYFETFKPYGVKFLQVNIENASGPVRINKVGMISQVYPYKKTGSFECSDPLLNEIWEMGWRTVVVCSEDTYTDTPFRERGLYAGDALPQYAISLAGSGDSRLMKRSIRVFADMYQDLMVPELERRKSSVNHMADYPLATLISWLWSVSITRDLDFAREFYEGYKNMLDAYISREMENGLFDHDRAFIEWTQIDKNANLTTVQSMIIYSLESFAWLADELGYNDDAIKFRQQASETKEKMLELCWNDEKKAFYDGFRDGKPIDHYYPISSAWPVIFGQTNEEMEEELKSHFVNTLTDIGDIDRKRNATPYGSFYIIEALYQMGMEDFAEFYMRKYWSAMIYKHGDTAWENFGDGSGTGGQGTLSHAWSGHPTYFMSTRVLGVQLGFPEIGFHDKIVIRPQAANISWARGEVPHPLGNVKVDWKIIGDNLFFSYAAPKGAEVIIEPVGKLAEKELILEDYID
ncbi:MAG: MGH1-like glycoside hydrolase domain-containing protein, partial [Bacteroidales bacterium]